MENDKLSTERLEKLKKLEAQGINPYPYSYQVTDSSKELLTKFSSLKTGEITKTSVQVMGRIMSLREMGKASFAHIQDNEGLIQVYFSEDDLKKNYSLLKLIDLGDVLYVEGTMFKTKKGEVTIHVKELQILAKSLRPFPEKYHGLKDPELRLRQRYLDLIVNQGVKETFIVRAQITNSIREFLHKKGFIDCDIPTLQPVYGGANAKPFQTHIHAWDIDLYLSISPELYLKRLIIGGFDKVYTIAKNFRNEGVDKTHNPEFTMMECYWAGVDYNAMMELVEDLYAHVVKTVHGKMEIEYQGTKISFKKPWKRLTMYEALKTFANIDVQKLSDKDIFSLVEKHHIPPLQENKRGLAIAALFEALCEHHLIQPTFIYDYPKETSPLCKEKRGDPELIERFEPYIFGWEIGNAYSELTNPILQRKLLEEQESMRQAGKEEAHPLDMDFVKALEYGMPPTGGLGLGIDRMVMILTNTPSIREVILFPTMRPEES